TDTLLPQGLGKGATIAHKTGDIGSVVGDAGLIEIPNGQRYVATVMVKRPHNDPRAQELIRQISRVTYQALSQPIPKASPAAIANPPSEEKP
ncbi:MAG: serine hydrolase, partial [Acaryochloridaceae cyanobacterium RU_4_10]|nr:serine hydrolase [Acaryochloridaceae cyanobacterium RU_4_10]